MLRLGNPHLPIRRRRISRPWSDHHKQIEVWAEHNPVNFENRAAIVGAEIARIEGRLLDAQELYEKAIRSAHTNGFVHNEAIANELAARFYAARGFEKIANVYLRDARTATCVGARTARFDNSSSSIRISRG